MENMPDNVKDNPAEKREALLADRLRLHKGYRQRFVKGRNRHGRIHAFLMFGETLYGGDGRDWLIVGIAGAWSYDVYGLHVAHDGKKEKKPLRAEWLVHELTDAGEEV